MSKLIGKIAATEKNPTTIDDFYFWTDKNLILNPFDVVKVNHINGSSTFGVIQEIFHITDSPGYLNNYISSDFGDTRIIPNTLRIGMNYVKAKFCYNDQGIYIPVQNDAQVFLASKEEIETALGLKDVKNPVTCGYLEMYSNTDNSKDKVKLPVKLNSEFLIGPEGAHLNISGISGLAAKTSYAMFLLKSIQDKAIEKDENIAFVFLNVKGKDLLSIDEKATQYDIIRLNSIEKQYKELDLEATPFRNVSYFYPYERNNEGTYGKDILENQLKCKKAKKYKFTYEQDKENLDLLFSNIDDPNQTMDSIINCIMSGQDGFKDCQSWEDFLEHVQKKCEAGSKGGDKEITVSSWRKFKRIISKYLKNGTSANLFATRLVKEDNEIRLEDAIKRIRKHEIYVVDIAKQEEDMQAFVFGNVMRAIYNLKLGDYETENPPRIVIFIDELNKYASKDVPKSSPILRQIIDIAERGRSLGIVLFAAEQFRSAIHDRVTGNCSTHAYGRTNSIEVSKKDYSFVPKVYQNMMTRLKQGYYVIQNPMFNSLLSIKFPEPIYKQYK
jgi:hypothetical protein